MTGVQTCALPIWFNSASGYIKYEVNSLNRKQYANRGTYFSLTGRYVEGGEHTEPGSTSMEDIFSIENHTWIQSKIVYDSYYKAHGKLRLGVYVEGVFSTQDFFSNYSASILRAPAFQPTPESKTLFLESFRAYNYAALGKKIVLNVQKHFDIRLEGYVFQPFQEIVKQSDNTAKYGADFDMRYVLATLAAVYHTPIGPASLSLNYYHNVPEVSQEDRTPVTFLFHFGYILFNKRALD